MDHFHNKTGKYAVKGYAVKGYPDKLGVLLHGAPGNGKTSILKALAVKTGRSIVTIDLSSIRTNRQLRNVFFKKSYTNDVGETIELGFRDKIFLMEDLDADSEVIKDRSMVHSKAKKKSKKKNEMKSCQINLI